MKQLILLLFFPLLLWSQSNFDKGVYAFEEKKYLLAQHYFESHLKDVPTDSKTIEYLGDIAGYQKQWDDAIHYYKKLKLQFPKTANYHYKFGGALGMKAKSVSRFKAFGMIDDIQKAFETAASLDKKHLDVRWALVMFYIELPGIVGGSETKAQKYADELLKLSKVDGYLAKGYIDVFFKRYTNAEVYLKKAHEIGRSKTTFEKLYDLYLNKLRDTEKANRLRQAYNK